MIDSTTRKNRNSKSRYVTATDGVKVAFLFLILIAWIGKADSFTACPLSLTTTTISINGMKLLVEWADTPKSRSRGLSGRFSLDEDRGMLFVYPSPRDLVFWMKNTKIPLSIAFLDASGKIINIEKMQPDQTEIRYRSRKPAVYALEVNQNWFRTRGIEEGDRVSIQPPVLQKQ